MFDFEFDHIIKDEVDLAPEQGLFLWVFHADKIPPHIGISLDGCFFSLKSSGVDIDLETSQVLRIIRNNRIPSFLIELSQKVISRHPKEVYETYSKAQAGVDTCLAPIKVILGIKNSTKLSELLIQLKEDGNIKRVFGCNSAQKLRGIKTYSTADITNRLLHLENELK